MGLGIDVEVRSEFLRKMLFVGSSTNRNGTQTHFPRKLHAQVAKSAHALDGNRVAGTRGVTERVPPISHLTSSRERASPAGLRKISGRALR